MSPHAHHPVDPAGGRRHRRGDHPCGRSVRHPARRPARNGPHRPRHLRREHAARHLRLLPAAALRAAVGADHPDWTPVTRERLATERTRWGQQLDEATVWLLDNATTDAGSWPNARIIRFAIDYAGHARAVVLSEREETTKVELLLAQTVASISGAAGTP